MNRNIKPINPFVVFCQKVIPLAFDESMSYYECLCALTNYLQTIVVPAVNNNADAVTELQNYVENYFTNLDVQEEINNKLDQMAQSGQLTDIIAQYIELQGILAYNTINDMKNATNLSNGSFAKTYGYNSYNDGQGAYYKIRTITNSDVVDNKTIVALHNPSLIAELIISNYVETYNSVADMKNANNLVEGKVVRTCGYYSINDGGSALYKIRKFVVGDVTNNSTLILLNDTNYVAELIINNCVNVKQFGAKGDGITDDTNAITEAVNFTKERSLADRNINIVFPSGTYIISDSINISEFHRTIIMGENAIIKMNSNKPIFHIYKAMEIKIKDFILYQLNNSENSSCLCVEQSYICNYENIVFSGGNKVIDFKHGNNHIFDKCRIIDGNYGFYTTSLADNTNNTIINSEISSNAISCLYFGFAGAYYGQFNIENTYIEASCNEMIVVENGMKVIFNNNFINQLSNGTIYVAKGTSNDMDVYFNNNTIKSTSQNGYLFKNENQNANYIATLNNNFIGGLDSGLNDGYIYNRTDNLKPKIRYLNEEPLNLPNFSNLKSSNGVVENWSGTSYTLVNSTSPVSLNNFKINNTSVSYRVYLEKNILYRFTNTVKSNGSNIVYGRVYSDDEQTWYTGYEYNGNDYQEKELYFMPNASGYYKLYYYGGASDFELTGFKAFQNKSYINNYF